MKITDMGVKVPEILIPDENVNMTKWSVLACDQYTSDERYWKDVEKFVGGNPSTLHIMLPEIYINDPSRSEMIGYIKETMKRYIDDSVLKLLPEGFVLVERMICGQPRKGLMVAVDLEHYHYDIEKKPAIRATEQTILDRIPPRIEIRRGAMMEMPHVIVLMDDKDKTVIEPLYERRKFYPLLYDFDLMGGGGNIKGYFVNDKMATNDALYAMMSLPEKDGMRFAVGDGNHSLATAKEVWEREKILLTPEEQAESPLRYALVELINIHDEGLMFMPIHRVIMGTPPPQCVQYVVDKLNAGGVSAKLVFSRRRQNSEDIADSNGKRIYFCSKDSVGWIELGGEAERALTVEVLQPILEQYVEENPTSAIEYVHSDEALAELTSGYDNLGFIMPALNKDEFFDMIVKCGVLPKKTFSIGEENQKRYYLECRLLSVPEEEETEEEEVGE